MFHYTHMNKDKYGIYHDGGVLYLADDANPLINEFGLYIIDKLHRFQNMQSYAVTEDTDIEAYVHECVTLHDDTKIYRFSKELLAYLETCVAYSAYYLQNDPRTAGALDTYYASALQAYATVSYEDLHAYLTRRLTAWYKRFPLAKKKTVVSMEDADVGDVVMAEGGAGGAVRQVARKPRYSLEVEKDDDEGAPAAALGAGAPAAVAAARADGTAADPP